MVAVALGLLALTVACGDTPTPVGPEPPPQLEQSLVYTNTQDKNGSPNGLSSNDVYAFLSVSNGEFWVGTSAGVTRYASTNTNTRGGDDVINEVNGLPHPYVRSMVELDGKVYVGTWGGGLGVYDIAGDAWTQIRPAATGLTNGFVAELATSPTEDKLYLATNNGVYIFAPGTSTWTHFDTVDVPEDDFEAARFQSTISCLEVTEDAGIVQRWYGPRVDSRVNDEDVGLYGIVVSKNTSPVFKYTPVNSGLEESNVNDIYFDTADSTYWVSYVTKGISQVDVRAKTWTDYTLVQGLPSNTVYSIVRAGDGTAGGTTMWAATQGGLAKLKADGHWQGYGVSGGLSSNRVRRVYSDDGHRLWVGFIDAGAARIKL